MWKKALFSIVEKLKEGPNFLFSLLQLYSSTSKLKFWFENDFNSWKDWSFLKNWLFWSNQNSNVENIQVNEKLFSHTLFYIEDFCKKKKSEWSSWSKYLISFVSRIGSGEHDQASRSSTSVTCMTHTLTSSYSNDPHAGLGACVKVRTSEIPSTQFAKKVTIVKTTNKFLAISEEETMPLV